MTFFLFDVSAAFAHTPHDVISKLEISSSYEQDKTLLIIVRNNLLRSEDGGYSWKRIVKGLDNRHLLSFLVISSDHSNKFLFLSSDGDGIYKSQNKGHSWFKVNNGLGSLNIGILSISADYTNDKIVLAAGTKKGLYKTKNGGESWYQVIDSNDQITAIASFPDQKGHILFGDRKGLLYLSTDGGDVWKQHFQIANSGAITAIAVSPTFSLDNTFFVETEKGGIFKTVDGGVSFSKVNNGISDKSIISLVISPNYKIDSTIFASTWHEAVFRSNDGGKTWNKYSKGLTSDFQADQRKEPHFMELKISKTFGKDKTIFLGGYDGLFKSTDGGYVWKQMDTLSLRLIIGLALSPSYKNDSTVAITTYVGGAYKTTDKQGIA